MAPNLFAPFPSWSPRQPQWHDVKPKSHQSRTQHGSSRITPEQPGPRDASIRGEPGWKCFDGPSTDDGRSKNIVNTDSTRQHYGWTRSQHGWPRTTTAAPRTVPDQPRTMPDPTRCQHGWSQTTRTIPDALRTAPNPTRTAQDRPVSETFMFQQSCIFVYFVF